MLRRRFSTLFAAAAALSGSACGCGTPTLRCVATCSEGESRCEAGGVSTCLRGRSGCPEWSASAPCGPGEVCGSGACQPACAEVCTEGIRRCGTQGVESCRAGASGCAAWSLELICGLTQACEAGACVSRCTDACASGARRCGPAGPEACSRAADGCLTFAPDPPCLSGGSCAGGACVAACEGVPSSVANRRLTTAPYGSNAPALVAIDSGYTVLWQDGRAGVKLYLAPLDAEGAKTGSDVLLSPGPGASSAPSAAASGGAIGVAISDTRDANGGGEIYFLKVDAVGRRLVADVRLTQSSAQTLEPAIAATADGFAVAYVETDAATGRRRLEVVRLDAQGAPTGAPVVVPTAGDPGEPTIAADPSGLGVAWHEGRSSVWFARLGAGAATPVKLSAAARALMPSIAWTGTDFVVAFADDRGGQGPDIHAARVDLAGRAAPAVALHASATRDSVSPRLLFAAGEFAMSWGELSSAGWNVMFARFDAGLARLGSPLRVTTAPQPSALSALARGDKGFLAAFGSTRDGDEELYDAPIPCVKPRTVTPLNWVQNTFPTQKVLTAVDAVDPLTAYAVGQGGTIVVTRDGGGTYAVQTVGTATLQGVAFIDAKTGWAVGDSGTIFHTADGTTWTAQTSPTAAGLDAVEFIDAKTGFIAGTSGMLLSTDDGGNTWRTVPTGTWGTFFDLRFPTATEGYAVGWDGTAGLILRTGDRGATWKLTRTAVPAVLNAAVAVAAPGAWFVGYATGSGGGPLVLYTPDHAATLVPRGGLPLAGGAQITYATAYGPGQIAIVGSDGASGSGLVLRSHDGGLSWAQESAGTSELITGIDFVSPSDAFLVGGSGTFRSAHTPCAGADPAGVCDDLNPCTADTCCTGSSCGARLAYCLHTARANLATCDDGDACTGVDACSAGRCVGAAKAGCTVP